MKLNVFEKEVDMEFVNLYIAILCLFGLFIPKQETSIKFLMLLFFLCKPIFCTSFVCLMFTNIPNQYTI